MEKLTFYLILPTMFNGPIYVIDFEGSLAGGIVEYGIVGILLDKGIFETRTRLCQTNVPIAVNEYRCHGISDRELVHHPPFSQDLELFIKARQHGIFCAHNAAFENQLLSRYCPVLEIEKSFESCDKKDAGWGPWLDTYGLYKHFLPRKVDCGLSHLISMLHLETDLNALANKFCPSVRKKYHCALYDALASALLLLKFARMPQNQGKDLNQYIAQSTLGVKAMYDRNQTTFL
ncbi:MAG: 3'-5' exonuclease [Puniceicoccales bacterium]|nr:3'-5' exonuclease [Puniceicoccales bacterium]